MLAENHPRRAEFQAIGLFHARIRVEHDGAAICGVTSTCLAGHELIPITNDERAQQLLTVAKAIDDRARGGPATKPWTGRCNHHTSVYRTLVLFRASHFGDYTSQKCRLSKNYSIDWFRRRRTLYWFMFSMHMLLEKGGS
jgi:hypothetical protein